MVNNLKFLFMPRYWIMNDRYCELHEAALIRLLEHHELELCSMNCSAQAILGNHYLRISAWPLTIALYDLYDTSRPGRNTMLRLEKIYKEKLKERKELRRLKSKSLFEQRYQ